MNFARAHNNYLEPPEDDPYCEDGCGQTLVRDIEGEWVCENKYCPKKFQGVEQEMANRLADTLDILETTQRRYGRLKQQYDDLLEKFKELVINFDIK